MRKKYVLDTNVLIHNPESIFAFEDNEVIIPLTVIQELDKLKSSPDGMVGYHARQAGRTIRELLSGCQDYGKGIELPNGGRLKVEAKRTDTSVLADSLSSDKNDNKILAVALNTQLDFPEDKVIFVTKDVYAAITGEVLGLTVEDFENDKIKSEEVYSGWTELIRPSVEINHLYRAKELEIELDEVTLYPNQMVLLRAAENPNQTAVVRHFEGVLYPLQFENTFSCGIKPKNLQQKMAYELIMNDDIPFVTVIGPAGTGKTILSLAPAIEKAILNDVYSRVILVRPVVAAGEDIGYLPGDESEKLKPWMGSFYDAFERLNRIKPIGKEKAKDSKEDNKNKLSALNDKNGLRSSELLLEELKEKGLIEMKTFTYMRGRSLSDAIVIIDEAQEMTPHLAKLMLTRAGENTKIIMIGDPSDNQIDNVLVDSKSNGLVYVVDRLKESPLAAHMTLTKVERSPLAKMAEKFL